MTYNMYKNMIANMKTDYSSANKTITVVYENITVVFVGVDGLVSDKVLGCCCNIAAPEIAKAMKIGKTLITIEYA